MLLTVIVYLCCGAVVGVVAGLFGVGGGTIIVPMLLAVFPYQGVPAEYAQQMALGTSLASIVFTSISSVLAHHKRGAVDWKIFTQMTPGLLAGTFFGGLFAAHLPGTFLKIFFICFLIAISAKMFSNYKPKASRHMPGAIGTASAGGVIGVLSSFVGIGGGSLSVPFMTYCGVDVHKAVGTAAALGFPIAFSGAIGYIVGGWNVQGLPPASIGFVQIWALFGIAVASVLTAPLGVKLSHALDSKKLTRAFAVFLLLIALKMIWDVFFK